MKVNGEQTNQRRNQDIWAVQMFQMLESFSSFQNFPTKNHKTGSEKLSNHFRTSHVFALN